MNRYLLLLLFPIIGRAFVVIDPTNLIQNTLTAKNSVAALINQVKSVQYQLRSYQENAAHLDQYHYQDVGRMIQRLDEITRQGQALSYAMQDQDHQFKTLYPNYTESGQTTSYQQSYKNWNQTTHTTLNNTLKAIGLNTQALYETDTLMKSLQIQSQNAQGRMQVLQVANELSAQNVHQLEGLKHLMAAQVNAQTAFMAHEVAKNSYQEQSLQTVTEQLSTNFPTYRNNTSLGQLSEK